MAIEESQDSYSKVGSIELQLFKMDNTMETSSGNVGEEETFAQRAGSIEKYSSWRKLNTYVQKDSPLIPFEVG